MTKTSLIILNALFVSSMTEQTVLHTCETLLIIGAGHTLNKYLLILAVYKQTLAPHKLPRKYTKNDDDTCCDPIVVSEICCCYLRYDERVITARVSGRSDNVLLVSGHDITQPGHLRHTHWCVGAVVTVLRSVLLAQDLVQCWSSREWPGVVSAADTGTLLDTDHHQLPILTIPTSAPSSELERILWPGLAHATPPLLVVGSPLCTRWDYWVGLLYSNLQDNE